jgi:hypothetical protein
MHEPRKSDSLIVPMKSPNKAGQPAAEAVEGRGLAKGNPPQQNAPRTQCRNGAHRALERVREAAGRCTASTSSPEARAGCGNSARPDPRRGSRATVIPTPTRCPRWRSVGRNDKNFPAVEGDERPQNVQNSRHRLEACAWSLYIVRHEGAERRPRWPLDAARTAQEMRAGPSDSGYRVRVQTA